MFTMYQTFAALADGESITAKSTGFGHARARAEIMRYINHRSYPNIIFKEEVIKASKDGKLATLRGDIANKFDAEWDTRFDELAGTAHDLTVKGIAYSPMPEDRVGQQFINTRVIKKLSLELPVIESVEAQREEARAREEKARALAKDKEFVRELEREDKRLAAKAKSRGSEIEQERRSQSMAAVRGIEKDLVDKNLKTLIEQLPDAEAVSGDFRKFIEAMKDKQNRGITIKKSEQELCEFIVGSIVPNLLKRNVAQNHETKPPGRS